MNKIMNSIGVKSRRASEKKIDLDTKNKVLKFYAELLDKENKSILRENSKDINFAKKKGIKENLINRLRIDEAKLKNIKSSIIKISKLKDPVNVILKKWSRPNGWRSEVEMREKRWRSEVEMRGRDERRG